MHWQSVILGSRGLSVVQSTEVVCFLGGSKCTIYMVRSIGGTGFVHHLEVVHFSEGLLSEVLLNTIM